MAVPSRAFVGMVVFGLIASLALVPYTLLVVSGYEAPPESVQELYVPKPDTHTTGDKVVLVLGSLFSLALTVFAWRGLLAAARRDERLRQRRRDEGAKPTPRDEQPPGYQ